MHQQERLTHYLHLEDSSLELLPLSQLKTWARQNYCLEDVLQSLTIDYKLYYHPTVMQRMLKKKGFHFLTRNQQLHNNRVNEILRLAKSGVLSQSEVAEKIGVHRKTVGKVIREHGYKDKRGPATDSKFQHIVGNIYKWVKNNLSLDDIWHKISGAGVVLSKPTIIRKLRVAGFLVTNDGRVIRLAELDSEIFKCHEENSQLTYEGIAEKFEINVYIVKSRAYKIKHNKILTYRDSLEYARYLELLNKKMQIQKIFSWDEIIEFKKLQLMFE